MKNTYKSEVGEHMWLLRKSNLKMGRLQIIVCDFVVPVITTTELLPIREGF